MSRRRLAQHGGGGSRQDPPLIACLVDAPLFAEWAGVLLQTLRRAIEREGNPAFVIGDVADEINADVIVMGTRGITLESDQQSTAARVIQLAPCPVLVVP